MAKIFEGELSIIEIQEVCVGPLKESKEKYSQNGSIRFLLATSTLSKSLLVRNLELFTMK